MALRKPLPCAFEENTASLYVRLSREAGFTNMSKDGMVREVKELAAARGLRVVAVHLDDGLTGALRNRPEFLAWLADAKHGRADHLIAHHVDRMTREGVNVTAAILDTIEGKDPLTGRIVRAPVILLDTKGLDSGGDEASFRFKFIIAAEIARGERERMRVRSRDSNRRLRAAGRWPGGGAPFGYRVVDNPAGAGQVLEIEPVEAALVRECASRVLAGSSLNATVRFANGPKGCPPRRAAVWSRTSLRQVLTGYPIAGKSMRHVDGKWVPVRDEEGKPVTFEGIVTADESAALREVLKQMPDAKKGGRKLARLLSGLLRCHGCGRKMSVARRTDGSVTYRCQNGREAGDCAAPVSISALPLEAHVEAWFLGAYGELAHKVRFVQVAGAAAVEAAEQAVSAALEALGTSATAEAFAALQAAQAQREEALAVPREAVVTLVETGRSIAEEWAQAGVEERRSMLVANVADIIVKPGKRGIHGINPNRLDIVAQPAFAGEASAYVDGRVVA
jgi:DNA invertase Pin-like site-specific DNA recombinase